MWQSEQDKSEATGSVSTPLEEIELATIPDYIGPIDNTESDDRIAEFENLLDGLYEKRRSVRNGVKNPTHFLPSPPPRSLRASKKEQQSQSNAPAPRGLRRKRALDFSFTKKLVKETKQVVKPRLKRKVVSNNTAAKESFSVDFNEKSDTSFKLTSTDISSLSFDWTVSDSSITNFCQATHSDTSVDLPTSQENLFSKCTCCDSTTLDSTQNTSEPVGQIASDQVQSTGKLAVQSTEKLAVDSSPPSSLSISSNQLSEVRPIALLFTAHTLINENMQARHFRKRSKDQGFLTLIKEQMDLQKINGMIKNKEIKTFGELRDKCLLMFTNAIAYYPENSQITQSAKYLIKFCDESIERLCNPASRKSTRTRQSNTDAKEEPKSKRVRL